MWKDGELWRDYGPTDIHPWLDLLPHFPFKPSKKPFEVAWVDRFPHAEQARKLAEGLGLGGRTLRILYRRVKPHSHIWPHEEELPNPPYRRFHIPLVTDPRIYMRWPGEGKDLHLAEGRLWEVRYEVTHEVHNSTDIARIHVQIDQADATI